MLEAIRQHAWQLVLVYLALGAISLLFSKRSQIDAWAEANPRLAGVMKLLRALNLDPWMLVQALSLLLLKRLPQSSKGPKGPPDDEQPVGQVQIIPSRMPPRVPPGSAAMIGLFALFLLVAACASPASPPKLPPTSSLPPGDPCKLEAISVFAESCGGDCDRNGGDVAACKAACKAEIKERCAQ